MPSLLAVERPDERSPYATVNALCEHYARTAEKITNAVIDGDREALKRLRTQYEKGRREAVEIAINLQDQIDRHASLYSILVLCMKASDFQVAILITRAITTRTIQDKVREEFPEYFFLSESDGYLHPSTIAIAGGILG